MGRLGCTIDGNLDVSKFSQPMPWIGAYVAAASAACAIAMAVDAFHGLRNRKLWFPCKYFSLNATTLTLIAVAIKFSVDLNTSMPRKQDQLAKVSSAVFICTVMGNSMPSLGTMENKEIFMNVVALGILVITAIVNICIQMGTGVIYTFQKEHAFVMFLMLVLLAILSSSALTVPTTKRYFDLKYSKKHQLTMKEWPNTAEKCTVNKLRGDLRKYWMMAHTCCPQFVMGRSATCTASGAFCLLSAAILAEAMLRSYFMPWSFKFCHGESDYKWSTTLVLVTQTIAVGIGTIATAFRWFTAINFRCPKKASKAIKPQFKVESYWIQTLVEWKERPLATKIYGRHGRKLAHNMKEKFLELCIGMQTGVVLVSKMVRLSSIYFVSRFLICYRGCRKVKWLFKCNNSVSSDESGSESRTSSNLDLSRYVLYLEGEEELVDLMTENNCDATDRWFRMGKKLQSRDLIQLLEKSTSSQEFKGVLHFDSDQVPSLDSEEPPNCWALPVVTLTSIAVALPNIDYHVVKQLISGVHIGIMCARLVENSLHAKEDFKSIMKAADNVWLGVDLHHKWLDVDLRKMALQVESSKEVLEGLTAIAKERFLEFKKREMTKCLWDSPHRWPIKALAANSMYRICQTILQDYESRDYGCSETLFGRVSVMISDILCACFTNLERTIYTKCHQSTIEEREDTVCHAILLLGKSEKILKILNQKLPPSLNPDQMASIDKWRECNKQKKPLHFTSSLSSAESDTVISFSPERDTVSTSPDLHLTIE
ncbi:uncharacterized protein LOC132305401 [Cornus florida]|uniref:uncharacterized protein LOC132305401 n=1 Tax=Cornus florida TaxID=4283 RepID=UPI00289CF2F1|nr:uncharacterized protein LOC132305401 [Cornus florida]